MPDGVIRVEHLSKRYRIGALSRSAALRGLPAAAARHDTLRDGIADLVRRGSRIGRRLNPQSAIRNPQSQNAIWALRDVSFEVRRGEVVGIIGRNGAGKSTLLKILSRITEPTEGRAEIHGRVGSLLEVGTGFHPELTGRENIYLNGAILGMHRAEIDRRFDEIVDFADIERFLDTPVKRYSSGMYVRLAFAVAAHLEPEILLVDEVLAVGDVAFQKKCLGKIGKVSREGRTVLFVSHNMAAVEGLCPYTLLLQGGAIRAAGRTSEVVHAYTVSSPATSEGDLRAHRVRSGTGRVRFTAFEPIDSQGQRIGSVRSGDQVSFRLSFHANTAMACAGAVISFAIVDQLGRSLFLCRSDFLAKDYTYLPREGCVLCTLPRLPLPAGCYQVNLRFEVSGFIEDWIQRACTLDVEVGDFFGSGRLPEPGRGDLLVEQYWTEIEPAKDSDHA
jgi:lipopolysaccharide transport system ATP-binding protein